MPGCAHERIVKRCHHGVDNLTRRILTVCDVDVLPFVTAAHVRAPCVRFIALGAIEVWCGTVVDEDVTEVTIDGNTTFAVNTAGEEGGETQGTT